MVESAEQPKMDQFWASRVVDQETIAFKQAMHEFERLPYSKEFLIRCELALARLRVDYDDDIRRKSDRLFRVFTMLAFPNMLPREQEITLMAPSPEEIFDEEFVEIDDDIKGAISWIWRTFDLKIPTHSQRDSLLLLEGG